MSGSVVTFYSYKGGVGRSFALANIAVLLGRWGFRVLCIDWDLESPGLAHFFGTTQQGRMPEPFWRNETPGLVELITKFKDKKQMPLQWRDYIIDLSNQQTPQVWLLKAGVLNETYSKRLHKLNWSTLYRNGLGDALEVMFDELREEFDYVLIDARTGVTDFSGIIIAQLPDILAFFFTANEQSFEGVTDIVRRALIARNDLSVDRSRLFLLPIPARFEVQVEHDISGIWRKRFSNELAEFYEPWSSSEVSRERLVQSTTIPYVPIWSFGERLSVVEDTSSDSLGINYSLETIAALLAHRLGQTRLLMDSRDEFVSSARRVAQKDDKAGYSVYLSYHRDDAATAVALAESLGARGLRTYFQEFEQRGLIGQAISESIDRSAHMVVLLSERARGRKQQDYEIRTFLRQAATDKNTRLLIPFTLGKMDGSLLPDPLQQYKITPLHDDYESAAEHVLRFHFTDNDSGAR